MPDPIPLDRRAFLRWLGLGLGATSVAACTTGRTWETAPSSTSSPQTTASAAPPASARLAPAPTPVIDTSSRILVVLELRGGNDGLSTVVPAGDPALVGLRGDLAPSAEEVVELDGEVGFHPALANVAPRLSVVQGVVREGGMEPDLAGELDDLLRARCEVAPGADERGITGR
ncbi:MAG: hypothetical protein AAGF02_20205, partial [Actinomycetota bacterium]